MPRFGRVKPGLVITTLLASAVTALDVAILLSSSYEIPAFWAWLQLIVVLGAWVAVFAWATQRWALAAFGLLLTLAGLWGYFYVGPVIAVVLAVVASVRSVRSREWPLTPP